MDELEKTAQETAEETGGMAPDAGSSRYLPGNRGYLAVERTSRR